ncbi:MAG TPA: hypothetical protein VL156_19130 [Terriglobales bacterium]|jgi:hypothetical protein|nr:hypothetical protein [Terriglobales bacterium]
MRLLRLSDVEISRGDRIYASSRTRALLCFAILFGTISWLVFHAYTTSWKPGYFIAGVIFLFFEFMRRFFTARFRPSNWLVRMNDTGLYIQFRSYLNYHLPAEDLTVVLLSFPEISSARYVKERVEVPDPGSGGARSSTQYLRYVELELAGDLDFLMKALETEAAEKAPLKPRWYGKSSTLYQDHPVHISSPPFLEIRWTVNPGPHHFLESLRPYTTIADPVSLTQDFTHLQSLDRSEQQQRLRELASRGETIAAIYIARRLYGCGLAEAKKMVEGLAGNTTEGS